MSRRALVLATVVGWMLAACGGPAFHLTSSDNDRGALARALSRRALPARPAPLNPSRTPRVFLLAGGPTRQLIAYDLQRGAILWKQSADVQSRIWVGGTFLVTVEHAHLVARDQQTGAIRWQIEIPGELVGATADADRAYLAYKENATTWWLAGYDGASGERRWRAEADGILGAPMAHGGVVYVPYNQQWLSLVDGETGAIEARIRGIDEGISMLRVTSRVAFYGSKRGVFRLDERSASGKRADSSYGQVALPPPLDTTTYGRDTYDPIQNGYTAADRARILYVAPAEGEGFSLAACAVHYFRFVFGFARGGELAWAYSNPRVELVASEDTGAAILAISQTGELVALDPASGAVRLDHDLLGGAGTVLGATFDADGWSPPAPGASAEPPDPVTALASIARDHDARFDRVKELAVRALAHRPGGEVTRELLGVLADPRAPQHLKDVVVDLLVARKDPASLSVLTAQLAVHDDFLVQGEPLALGPVARAIAGLGGAKLDPRAVTAALSALQSHLDAATTQVADLVFVIDAMAAIGGGQERPALGSHLLLYHADDELGSDPAWGKAIATALETHGGPGERELLRRVAADPRSRPGLVAILRDALVND